ncbi:hypothetical protein EVAR_85440_1 [Eumeta japonica]|uniref:Uncharacterized protein n=1 Tax=Eumeta variegata TaxID=151549 RepID=A0A4C1WII8_EUMVA|nr:hypothetical protein EVAR_85440_1 [Eumeta japonica]
MLYRCEQASVGRAAGAGAGAEGGAIRLSVCQKQAHITVWQTVQMMRVESRGEPPIGIARPRVFTGDRERKLVTEHSLFLSERLV